MTKLLVLSVFLMVSAIAAGQQQDFQTYYEQSGCTKTPRYDQTVEFCKKLDKASAWLTYSTFGKSPRGRSLPLLIADRNGNFTPEAVKKSGNAVLLIEAGIHAGEIDGKDAGLMLMRDIAVGKKMPEVLDHVTILFIPIFNVDGHERFGPFNRINQDGPEEMGWRTTAQNLNLNRDFMKADAPEMQAWLKLFSQWNPDFFIDCHVTDGADYQYALTYALETKGTMEKHLSDWTSEVCEPFLVSQMKTAGFPVFPYVEFRNWHDPRSGLLQYAAPPMLSQGYCAVRNRPGLLIETHMLKPYKVRVDATYQMLFSVARLLNAEYKNLQRISRQADEYTAGESFRKQPFPVSFDVSEHDSVQVDFLGFDYTVDTSDLTGGLWFRYDRSKPSAWKLPLFGNCMPDKTVMLPEAYILPPELTTVIERLKLHGVEMTRLNRQTSCQVRISRFENVKWQSRSYEGHHKLDFTMSDSVETRTFPAGSMLIAMNQPLARVIAHALEPGSPDSFAAWGFFDAYLEQKEYSESYVMETMAREMMAKDPALKTEFEKMKAGNKAFAGNPDAMLNWLYSKSPYWDASLNVYPVGRIIDGTALKKILLSGK